MAAIEIVTDEGVFTAEEAGSPEAPCVLLLHGFPQTRHAWRDVLPALADAGYRAVAPDQRGYSPGVRPHDVDEYRIDRLVGDVIDLLDVLGVDRVHLVGHDRGGPVAWMTAAHHPDRLASLCVLSRPHPAAFLRALADDPEQADRSRHHTAFQSLEITDTLMQDNCAPLRWAFLEAGVPQDAATAYLEVLSERAALDAALNWYRAAFAAGLRTDAGPVSVPTLFLWGDHDQTVGRMAAELTAEYVSGPYRFVEVPGSGHFLTDDGGVAVVVRELLAHLGHRTP